MRASCVLLLFAACGDNMSRPPELPPAAGPDAMPMPEETGPFRYRGSVEQVHIWRAMPGAAVELLDAQGQVLASGMTDELGSLVLRAVAPGQGYRLRDVASGELTAELSVLSVEGSTPPEAFYASQELQPGFGYIETRDGTKLSIYVTLPGPIEDGPYPTIVNYSGYEPSKPGAPLPLDGVPVDRLCGELPVLCDAPNDPSGILGGMLGFATVGINMRGTGCSGGAYDFFEPLQLLDGYDAIETIAAQPWVKGNRVAMTGLSYPGITQLFVASTKPPSLAAITPLSVISDVQSTLIPGGILNDGFAVSWAQSVLDNAGPYGQGWEQDRVDAGDTICEENQLLHGQKVDLIQKAYENQFYTPEVAGALDLNLKVPDIEVPVFLAGAWQDEQTGPGFAALLDKFTGAPLVRITVYNGVHPDGYSPQVLIEWFQFLSLYLAEEIPVVSPTSRSLAPFFFEEVFGARSRVPPDRFADFATVAEAKEVYEAEPPVRVIFDVGTAEDAPAGYPTGAWEESFASWPLPETAPLRLFFHGDGTLRPQAPANDDGAASRFVLDPAESQRTSLARGGDPWDLIPAYDWAYHDSERAVVFESELLTEGLVMVGHASVDLWIQSTAGDADLEVTISEVTPEGKEIYVQSGWLRASVRALAEDATELRPVKTFREEDASPLPEGAWELARVEVFAFSHAFRAGSKIRVSVDTPGGSRPEWRFAFNNYPEGTAVGIAHTAMHPSSVALPVVSGLLVETPLPACGSLRGQPCRDARAYTNTPW